MVTELAPVARRLLRPREVKDMLGIGRGTAYALIRSGALGEPVRVGRSVRVPIEAIDKFIAERGAR